MIAKGANRAVYGTLKLEGYGDAYRKLCRLPASTIVAPPVAINLKKPQTRSKL
jgi:hypothetical protein